MSPQNPRPKSLSPVSLVRDLTVHYSTSEMLAPALGAPIDAHTEREVRAAKEDDAAVPCHYWVDRGSRHFGHASSVGLSTREQAALALLRRVAHRWRAASTRHSWSIFWTLHQPSIRQCVPSYWRNIGWAGATAVSYPQYSIPSGSGRTVLGCFSVGGRSNTNLMWLLGKPLCRLDPILGLG